MSSYLPEKCFVVCTKQMGFGYRRLLVDGEVRRQVSVIMKTGNRPWLTIADRKIDKDFECQSQWSSTVAWGAFAGGLATGVLVTAIAVGWIPVAGWIAVGVVAVVAVAAAAIAGVIAYFANDTKCSDRLRSVGSEWIIYHPTVKFDGINAVNKRSILQCQEGGSLLPFISESLAADAAQAIALRNMADVGVNGLATFISGFFVGLSFTGVASVLAAGAWFAGGMAFGIYVINPATEIEKEYLRDNFFDESETYDNMNRRDAEDGRTGLQNFIPEDGKSPLDGAGPDTEWNPKDVVDTVNDLRAVRELAIKNGASNQSVAQLDEAIRSAERHGSFSPEKNPEMRAVVENIKNGTYGEDVKAKFTNRSGNMRGMNRRANYDKAIEVQNEQIRTNRTAQKNAGGRIAGNLIQIFQPFISTFFSEWARSAAAKYAEQDLENGVGVLAVDN